MRLLVIDRDKEFQNKIVKRLMEEYVVDLETDGSGGMYASQVNEYDIVVIGDTLPDIDGLEVCRMIRVYDIFTPIILIFDSTEPLCRIRSLDEGADAVFIGPINYEELEAQVRALIRRNGNKFCGNILKAGDLELNMRTKNVLMNGHNINLRRKEFEVLEYLLVHKGRVVSKEELLEHIWEDGINIFSNTVEVHIRSLRIRMERTIGGNLLKTIRGFGYKIET